MKFKVFMILICSSIVLTYISIRAYALSFTHDESTSFTIIEGNTEWVDTANNHILNTLLMTSSCNLFGNSEFSLRLPNVLSFVLYMIGCFYMLKYSKNNWIVLLGLSLFLLNPFLIEFFSLARGYGLSLGFMTISLFFMLKSEYRNINSPMLLLGDFLLSSLFASLALYANLAMINFCVGIIVIFSFRYIVYRSNHPKSLYVDLTFSVILLVSFIPILLGLLRLFKLKKANMLYYGASSFIEGVDSLINASIYGTTVYSWVLILIKITILIFMCTAIISIVIKKKYHSPLFSIILLMLILVFGLVFEHVVFSANYPIQRTALFYIPILSAFIFLFVLHLVEDYKLKKRHYIPAVLGLIIPLLINFLACSNFTHTTTWRYDAETKNAMINIKNLLKNNNMSISSDWRFEPTVKYYNHIWKLNLSSDNKNGGDLNTDFIYQLNDPKFNPNYKSPIPDNYKEIASYSEVKSRLLIRIKTP